VAAEAAPVWVSPTADEQQPTSITEINDQTARNHQ
jgi:hypothetical protein